MGKGTWYSKETKDEVLSEIAKGEHSAMAVAKQFGINPKTVYNWMAAQNNESGVSLAQFNRLKRENNELLEIIGELTFNLKKKKKLR